ncbi:helix-turn-helix domain-containing protein [Actinomycetota bacterium]
MARDESNAADFPQVLDTAMVAEMLGMNVQVVRRMAREGTIPAYRLPGGRSFRFFRDEVLDWLKSFPVEAEATEATATEATTEVIDT